MFCKVQVEMQREREGKFPAQESIELITETQPATADAGPEGDIELTRTSSVSAEL